MPILTKKPRVVHCKVDRFDSLIDRTTLFGNPFIIGKDGDRGQVIKKHKQWILGIAYQHVTWRGRTGPQVLSLVHDLHGDVLGCWCAPHACHGDILLELANKIRDEI